MLKKKTELFIISKLGLFTSFKYFIRIPNNKTITVIGKNVIIMIDSIKDELRLLGSLGWWYLAVLFIPILRKTVFNRIRDMNDFAVVDLNASIAILFTIIALYIVWSKWKELNYYLSESKTFIYYYLFCIISIIWAGFSYAPLIGFKAVEVLTSYLFVLLIMVEINNEKDCFRFVLSFLALSNVIYLIYSHNHENKFPLLGVTQYLLSLGAIKYNIFSRREMMHHLLISMATVILSTSSASWISLIIGLLFFFGTKQKGISIVAVIMVAVVFYVLWILFEDDISDVIFKNKTVDAIRSGTGRQYLWEAYIKGWQESPWLGYGFIVGEKGAIASKYILFATNTAHNMMISVLVNTGIIGMALWLIFLWKQCKTCWENSLAENPYALICFPAIIAMFVNANSFPVIGSEWSPISPPIYALIIFVFSYIPYYQKEAD